MNKPKKKMRIIFIFVLLLLLIASFFVWQHYLNNNIDYQLKMLESGGVPQKLMAADFFGDKKIVKALPQLINNVYNTDSDVYYASPKAPETVSCCVTFALEKITGAGIGDVCNSDAHLNEQGIRIIQDKWVNWYKNDYPKWLESQNNKIR